MEADQLPRTQAADIASLQKQAEESARFIGIRETEEISGYSRSTIKRKIKAGEFPAPVISEGVTVRWDYSEILRWRAQQFAKRAERLARSAPQTQAAA